MQIQQSTTNIVKPQMPFANRAWGVEKRHKGAKKTALVYCEKQFGLVDGKTAAALVRHSEIYTIEPLAKLQPTRACK